MARPKRREVLLDRLVTFCERCGSPELPVRVSEVIGYGSFFRGKDAPNDIDAIVVASGDHPLFEKFIGIVQSDIRRRYVPNPAEEMHHFASDHPDPEVVQAAKVFKKWLEGISYNFMFGAGSILQQIIRLGAPCFAERILGSGLPRIRFHVHRRGESTMAKVTHIIWTPDRPNVRANVERILGSDQRDDLLTEAEWFEKQARHYLLVNEVLVQVNQHLAHGKIGVRGKGSEKKIQQWAGGTDIGFSPALVSDILRGSLTLGEEIPDPSGYRKPIFDAMDTAVLRAEVEEKRKVLRRLMDRERVLSVIAGCLMHRQFVDRKALKQPLGRFLQGAIEERMYRRELNTKRIQAIIEEEIERILSSPVH